MDLHTFIHRHGISPETVDGPGCLKLLLEQMDEGLSGRGNIPMLPSYLSADIRPPVGESCCVLDAGGTNLRVARAEFTPDGRCSLTDLQKFPMPGTQGVLSAHDFYATLADHVRSTGSSSRIGFCFSYNVLMERELDGILLGWCKEVRVPDAPGKPVGDSLRRALGDRGSVRVLNDSTAALLGAHFRDPGIRLGLILGTGINICYPEACKNIPKVPGDLRQDTMIVSTEIGEFDGFPKSTFDMALIASTDEPELAHAEKQCAGGYLGELICLAWQEAVREGLLPADFAAAASLPQISAYLESGGELPENETARYLARIMIHRAAKIAAVLTAGPVLRCCAPGQHCAIAIEGSQFTKLTGFAPCFLQELEALLRPYRLEVSTVSVENSCLLGAALAAFAQPM